VYGGPRRGRWPPRRQTRTLSLLEEFSLLEQRELKERESSLLPTQCRVQGRTSTRSMATSTRSGLAMLHAWCRLLREGHANHSRLCTNTVSSSVHHKQRFFVVPQQEPLGVWRSAPALSGGEMKGVGVSGVGRRIAWCTEPPTQVVPAPVPPCAGESVCGIQGLRSRVEECWLSKFDWAS